MLCGLLRSEGIEAFANDTRLNTVDPLLSPALGWVRISVKSEDLDRATEILGERIRRQPDSKDPKAEEPDSCPACGGPLPEEESKCPACGWSPGEEE